MPAMVDDPIKQFWIAGESHFFLLPACPKSSFISLHWIEVSSGPSLSSMLAVKCVERKVMRKAWCCVMAVIEAIILTVSGPSLRYLRKNTFLSA